MITRKVQDVNGGFQVTLPKHICQIMEIEKGIKMNVEFDQSKSQIILTPVKN